MIYEHLLPHSLNLTLSCRDSLAVISITCSDTCFFLFLLIWAGPYVLTRHVCRYRESGSPSNAYNRRLDIRGAAANRKCRNLNDRGKGGARGLTLCWSLSRRLSSNWLTWTLFTRQTLRDRGQWVWTSFTPYWVEKYANLGRVTPMLRNLGPNFNIVGLLVNVEY